MKQSKLTYSTNGIGKNIVLIHGWGMHSGIWLDIANKLADSYRVTVFDLPGYGENSKFHEYHELADIAEVILPIIPQQAILLGWSMGGLIALWLAIHHSQTISKMILTNSTPCFVEKSNWPGISTEILEQFKEPLTENVYSTMQRFLTLQFGIEKYQVAKKQLFLLKKIMLAKPLPSAALLINQLNLLLTTDLRSQLRAAIQAPILYLLGESDRLVPVTVKQNLPHYLPQAQIKVFPGAGHIPFISHSELFLKVVTDFIYEK